MKRTKSYSSIWNVEKILHAVGDLRLPFALTFTQVGCIVISLLIMITFGRFISNSIIRYICIPAFITWFVGKKAFDGKKPYKFVLGVIRYLFRGKVIYAGKTLARTKENYDGEITIVHTIRYKNRKNKKLKTYHKKSGGKDCYQ